MRCPKCGFISFDYVNNCEKCGKDLGETAAVLGPFLMPAVGTSWFEAPEDPDATLEADTGIFAAETDAAGVDLADIDVSDLVSDEIPVESAGESEEVTVLDSDVIETVAVDEEFQKALDDVITD